MSDRAKKIIVYIVIILLGGLLIMSINRNYIAKQKIHNYSTSNQLLENKYQTLVGEDTAPTYVVNAQGHMDYKSARTIKKLNSFFTDMTTFQNQSQYNQNRHEAKEMTKDQSFLGPHGFEKTMYDSTGQPKITVSNYCMQTGNVHTYEVYPGEYLVIVDYYEAYNPATFNYIDILTPNHSEFLVNGDSHYFNTIKPIKGISLNNNNQDA